MALEHTETVIKMPRARKPSKNMAKHIARLQTVHKEKKFTKMIVMAVKADGDMWYSIKGFNGRLDGYVLDGVVEHFKAAYPSEE